MKRFILLVLLFVLSFSLSSETGEKFLFDSINLEDGLSNLSVSSIQEDSQGFLWFGTQSGLNRYDGYEFEVYNQDPFDQNSLPHGLVQTLYIDDDDIIWIGTYNGISRFDPGTSLFTNYEYSTDNKNSISNNVVTAITKDNKGQIWVGTLDGLNRLDPETGVFTTYFHEEGKSSSLMNNLIRTLLTDSEGQIWIGNHKGVERYDQERDEFIHFPYEEGGSSSLPSPYAMKIIEYDRDNLLVGTWDGGLSIMDKNTGRCENHSFADNRIYALEIDKDGKIWVGSWGGGIFVFNPEDNSSIHLKTDIHSENSINSNNIYSLFRDSTDILWVGTNGAGLNFLNYQKQDYLFLSHDSINSNSLDSGKIYAICEDSTKKIWVGIYNAGINVYDIETDLITRYRHDKDDDSSLSDDIVNDIVLDDDGNIWISTNSGINRYNRKTDSFERYYFTVDIDDYSKATYNYMMVEDGFLWVGSYYSGLLRVDLASLEVKSFESVYDDPETLSDNLVYMPLRRRNGEVWVATNKGLNRLNDDGETFQRYLLDRNNPEGINNNTIRVLMEDSLGRFWVGTGGGGLNLYNDEDDTFTHLTTRDGLSNNFIMSVNEGGDGNIWVGTKYGISIIDINTLRISVLDREDGITSMQFSTGAYTADDGTVYLGAVSEVSRFGTKDIQVNSIVPRLYFTGIEAGGIPLSGFSPYLEATDILLDYGKSFYLSFSYVALNYLSPENTIYAYKLEGYDSDWIDAGERRFALYTSLPPGEYVFRVKAANNNGVWNEEGISRRVVIEPPLWRTWWAYSLYFLFLVFIVALISFLGINRVRKQKLIDLEKARSDLEILNYKNEQLSIKDYLTGIYNRRHLETLMKKEFARAQRNETYLTVIMVDIDFFKLYNDTYGHVKGDRCLIEVVESMSSTLNRPNDVIARYGGEEFCIVLPDVKPDGARKIAARLLASVETKGILHSGSPFGFVSVSLGFVSSIPKPEDNNEYFLKSADNALYRAKREGRNRLEEEVI
ncbi:MAG: diguanylate cyclase [Spirochaetales bacterium]|nr:diguanylate cyclase [Spirochaetales bacterium]